MLLRDLRSDNDERRDRATTIIRYLYHADCFDEYKSTIFRSLVKCLSNLLPLSSRFETALAEGEDIHRTETERNALLLMYFFLQRFGVQPAIDYEILSLWLQKYPFGGDLETRYPGDKNSQLAAKHRRISWLGSRHACDHDPAMFGVLSLILSNDWAEETLLRHGAFDAAGTFFGHYNSLSDNNGPRDSDEERFSELWYEVQETTNAPELGLGPMMRRGPRIREDSIEEQALRRRRREAMVLGEMGRPIESDNIIQQTST
ncbi:MAG: hypothetical protein Q9169_001505 [Polycauliona sp. 2 TL-2023]